MALILDTNALCALGDGDEGFLRLRESEPQLAVPAIVLGEYLYGIHRSRRRTAYEAWLKTALPLLELLSVGPECAERYSEIRSELDDAGTPIPSNDLWIAALARLHRMPVATRDRHFRAVRGLRIVSW